MTSVPDSSLEAGLAALKQGDYQTAIAQLEAVCQTQLNQSARVKAQMGLVVAYNRTSKISRAIALCQTLTESTNPQVREWAIRHQAELTSYTADKAAGSTSPETEVTGVTNDRPLVSPQSFHWRRAGRAKRWQPLSAVNLIPLWLLQAGTAIAMFWLIRELLKFAMGFTNDLLVKLPYLEPFQPFYRDPTQLLLLTLGILICLSPWLLDALLRLCYGLQPLSIDTLSTHSPEAIRVLQRSCRQRRWTLPQLSILPTSAPLALTYGNLPRTARIVVSQGLLEQLASDEIATIYAGQLGHIAHRDFVFMSLVILITQVPYTVYWQVSQWGDRMSNQILQGGAALVATLAYGVWCLLSGPAVWLSQLRIYYSDRFAAEITGNPNGLTRALLKIAIGIAEDIQQQGHTSWLLESLNLLTSVGYRQAITMGSLHSCTQFEPVLAWDYLNPYRHWLIINNTHPLMGDRLQHLTRIARQWHLETELNLLRSQKSEVRSQKGDSPLTSFSPGSSLLNASSGARLRMAVPSAELASDGTALSCEVPSGGNHISSFARFRSLAPPHSSLSQSFLLQGAPFFGIPLGFAFGVLTWIIGGIGILLGIAQLAWMYGDWVIVKGCLPIGFSIGTLVRINSFFPDLKPSTVQSDTSSVLEPGCGWLPKITSLQHLLANPTALPVDSQPIRLQGKLLGRRGISNWLGQDLILHSPTGLVKLHHVSWLGPVGNLLLRQSPHPCDLVGRQIIATGWFRRGATPWIDIETLRTQSHKSRSGHPVWSTLLAGAVAVWGAYIILRGGA